MSSAPAQEFPPQFSGGWGFSPGVTCRKTIRCGELSVNSGVLSALCGKALERPVTSERKNRGERTRIPKQEEEQLSMPRRVRRRSPAQGGNRRRVVLFDCDPIRLPLPNLVKLSVAVENQVALRRRHNHLVRADNHHLPGRRMRPGTPQNPRWSLQLESQRIGQRERRRAFDQHEARQAAALLQARRTRFAQKNLRGSEPQMKCPSRVRFNHVARMNRRPTQGRSAVQPRARGPRNWPERLRARIGHAGRNRCRAAEYQAKSGGNTAKNALSGQSRLHAASLARGLARANSLKVQDWCGCRASRTVHSASSSAIIAPRNNSAVRLVSVLRAEGYGRTRALKGARP